MSNDASLEQFMIRRLSLLVDSIEMTSSAVVLHTGGLEAIELEYRRLETLVVGGFIAQPINDAHRFQLQQDFIEQRASGVVCHWHKSIIHSRHNSQAFSVFESIEEIANLVDARRL